MAMPRYAVCRVKDVVLVSLRATVQNPFVDKIDVLELRAEEELTPERMKTAKALIIDLSGCLSLGEPGMGILIFLYHRAKALGSGKKARILFGKNDRMEERIIRIYKFDHLFEVEQSEKTGRELLEEMTA